MMSKIDQVLLFASKGDTANFAREIKPIQKVVEDLCKLGHSDKIITVVRNCLEKIIIAKFDNLAQ